MNAISQHFASERFLRCPVCGLAENGSIGSADERRHARAYYCGSAFERIEGVFACTHPCPGPSYVAASHIIAEAKEIDHE
ncbi:hypothetical protein EDC90_102653 [Martelella mediterranea]|uniref:Uncharacterized protein n=1 Tax=Martelella mediterranea TaxID=293089 RepID=A0A4R3NLU2_9HYPH|nr:hypothetical protein EDC90_102653 [Martelella mediterranea]